MTDPLIPTPDDPVGRAIDALVARRPKALQHINYGTGVYARLFRGWRAQVSVMCAFLLEEVKAARIPLAEAEALLDLAAVEYDTTVATEPSFAIGEIHMTRTGAKPRGQIRKGHKFSREADPTVFPREIKAAEVQVVDTLNVAAGATSFQVKVRATRAGEHANDPTTWNYLSETHVEPNNFVSADTLFDENITISYSQMGGGASTVADQFVRDSAKAYAKGRYGANAAAIVAGAYRFPGVRHVAVIENTVDGITAMYPADETWSTSLSWMASILQSVRSEFQGFGCRVGIGGVANLFVTVSATVVLRDKNDATDASDITQNITEAIRAYFDLRPDWYVISYPALRGVISRADPRILVCDSVTVFDTASGSTVTTPSTILDSYSQATIIKSHLVHYWLANDGVKVTYTTAS